MNRLGDFLHRVVVGSLMAGAGFMAYTTVNQTMVLRQNGRDLTFAVEVLQQQGELPADMGEAIDYANKLPPGGREELMERARVIIEQHKLRDKQQQEKSIL